MFALGVARDTVAHLPCQVQAASIVLEHVDHTKALLVVTETTRRQLVEHAFAGVPERRVTKVVSEGNGLGQFLVQSQHLRDAPRNLRNLERVRQPRAVVIACRGEEDLRLVLQPAKGLGVDDAVPIALEHRADGILGLRTQPPAAAGAARGLGCEMSGFECFELLANRRHERWPVYFRIPDRKLWPWASGGTSNTSASVCPRSANVARVPMFISDRNALPASSTGTYSRE